MRDGPGRLTLSGPDGAQTYNARRTPKTTSRRQFRQSLCLSLGNQSIMLPCMEMSLFQIIFLALIQGAAELLPVSSSAHVIVAEKLMGLDPSAPAMTFLLVMLHTGTMFAVLTYFWPRWKKLDRNFFKMTIWATAVTGVIGLSLKLLMEKAMGQEIEQLFKNLPLVAVSLFLVGIFIIFAGRQTKETDSGPLSLFPALCIGLVQGLCLPFRGFSRSGATISTGLLFKIPRGLAEDFSFALAVLLTPPVILLQLHRLSKVSASTPDITPGLIGMVFSFAAGLVALRFLSKWLEQGRWQLFGVYCLVASAGVAALHILE